MPSDQNFGWFALTQRMLGRQLPQIHFGSYLEPNRLSDILAAIQAMGSNENYRRNCEQWSRIISGPRENPTEDPIDDQTDDQTDDQPTTKPTTKQKSKRTIGKVFSMNIQNSFAAHEIAASRARNGIRSFGGEPCPWRI